MATDAVVLKHQAIIIHSVDESSIVLNQMYTDSYMAFMVDIIKK